MSVPPPSIAGLSEWRPLARGGFALVWRARQDTLNRLVAVKVDQRPLDDEAEKRRFLREAGAAGRMSGHPGIVIVHDAGILPDERPYLVMELCPGGSLTRWLQPDNRQTQDRIREVGVRIADALAAAHARGVLHRDIKPANILINAYDQPGLADFGLAAMPEPGLDMSLTVAALTPAYAPVEAYSWHTPTEFGDVFGLAATMYALLGGHPPRWPDEGTPSLPDLMQRLTEPVEVLPGVSPDLMDTVLSGLLDEPHDRPTAAQFRDRLAAADLTVQREVGASAPVFRTGGAAASAVSQAAPVATAPRPAAAAVEPAKSAEPAETPKTDSAETPNPVRSAETPKASVPGTSLKADVPVKSLKADVPTKSPKAHLPTKSPKAMESGEPVVSARTAKVVEPPKAVALEPAKTPEPVAKPGLQFGIRELLLAIVAAIAILALVLAIV